MKNDMKMIIHIDLTTNFFDVLLEEMEKELEVACKKWDVNLNQEEKELVFEHSIKQVKRKVSENTKTLWDLSDVLTVKVNSQRRPIEIRLPAKEAETSKIKLFYTKDGWEIDQEMQDDAVRLADFAEHLENLIKRWSRTAVFYGVGSYAG